MQPEQPAQPDISRLARRTLATAFAALLVIAIATTLELGSHRHVPVPIFVICGSVAVFGGVGWVALFCTQAITGHIDTRMAHRDAQFDEIRADVVGSRTKVCEALAQFTEAVERYGDERATAAGIQAVKSLTQQSAEVSDNGRPVTSIHRRAAR